MRHKTSSWLLVGTLTVLAVGAMAQSLSTQSLGDAARKEEARRKALAGPVKTYTNDSLAPIPGETIPTPPGPAVASGGQPPAAAGASASGPTPAAPGAKAGADQPPPPPDPKKTPEYWKKRMTDAQTQRDRNAVYMDALQSRINGLWADFTARDDPAQRAVIGAERQKAIEELGRLKKDQADLEKQIPAIEEEARRAGVPPGWLR